MYDWFWGTGFEVLGRKVAVVLASNPQQAAPSTEQVAGVVNALVAASNPPLLGMKGSRSCLDGGAIKVAPE